MDVLLRPSRNVTYLPNNTMAPQTSVTYGDGSKVPSHRHAQLCYHYHRIEHDRILSRWSSGKAELAERPPDLSVHLVTQLRTEL